MKRTQKEKGLVIYETKKGGVELRGDFSNDTMWATQAQIADLFDAERSVITKHIRNIFKDNELDKDAVCAKFAHTADDGKNYNVQFYNLDVVLSVGYRTNSTKAIAFRRWASSVIKDYLLKGYVVNEKRLKENRTVKLGELEKTIALITHYQLRTSTS